MGILKTTWQELAKPSPEATYQALMTYLPLDSALSSPHFALYTRRVLDQLTEARGVQGYMLVTGPLRKQLWSLSVWEDPQAMNTFATEGFHRGVMLMIEARIHRAKMHHWPIHGSDIPPIWSNALRQWATLDK